MEPFKPIYTFNIFNIPIDIKPEAIIESIIVFVICVLAYLAASNLKIRPGKKQVVVEYIYELLEKVVTSNMGKEYKDVIPFIGALSIFILIMNLLGLIGIPSPTKNFSVTIALAAIVFLVIQGYAIRKIGFKHYLLSYSKPMAFLLPINIMERLMLPISLALRLFGNILAATFLIELIYMALGNVGFIAQLGLPIPLHAYFDIFDGLIQTAIFSMLTMLNIKMAVEH